MQKSFLIGVLLIFSFLFLANFALADNPPCPCTSGVCCDGCNFRPSSYVCNSWQDQNCHWGTGCGSDLGIITYTQHCSGNSENCNGSIIDSGWSIFQNCNSWENCTISGCACNFSCLDRPTGPAFPYQGSENVQLPVTLSWNAVNGAQSYHYKIEGTTEGVTTTPSIIIKNCVLNSSTTYNWKVRACCDQLGTNCGSWSDNWTFTTSLAPELLSPAKDATDVSVPVTFDWCDVNNAKSYYLQVYLNGNLRHIDGTTLTDHLPPPSQITVGENIEVFFKGTTYEWDLIACQNPDLTNCGHTCGQKQPADQCGEVSPRWQFTVGGELSAPELLGPSYNPSKPNEIPVVNFLNSLSWEYAHLARSFFYQIREGNETIFGTSTVNTAVSFEELWKFLNFNRVYAWRVKSCWDVKGENCQDGWSQEWKFKTTGAPPAFSETSSGPQDNAIDVLIPTKLNWDDMPEALSYYFEVSTSNDFSSLATSSTTTLSEVSLDYPVLTQDKTYWWRVKTCADEKGSACGNWNETRNFKTIKLSLLINPKPANNGELLTSSKYLQWDKSLGANFYQYTLDYDTNNPPAEETNQNCQNLRGQKIIQPTIVSTNSALVNLECLGNYIWWVRGCLDRNCGETGDLAGPWRFNLIQQGGGGEKGLIPCGRNYDNPDTPYNEREPCQIKHIFLLVKNILDFILWRLGLIILVFLTIATGVIYYFSMGAPTIMARVKSLLKSAGVGYGIIFLAWLIINWILAILGFQLGHWWQIIF